MFVLLRSFAKPNAQRRRIMSGLCAAFVPATIAFSSVFVATESDHDCPVCLEMQTCVANFQLLGSSLGGTDVVSRPAVSLCSDAAVVCAYRAPCLTLQRHDVRFDE